MHTGALVKELNQLVDVVNANNWHKVYFDDAYDGDLPIEPWILVARVRFRLPDGAAKDGVMSPGAVDAWYSLEPIQKSLMTSECPNPDVCGCQSTLG